MKKIGLFYGTATAKTAAVAKKIKEAFGEDIVDIIPVEQSEEKEFNAYEYIIAGSSTWFDGELPTYWDETLPELTGLDWETRRSIRIISPMESAFWQRPSPTGEPPWLEGRRRKDTISTDPVHCKTGNSSD